MKKVVLLLFISFALVYGVKAQEQGKLRLGLNTGFAFPKDGLGGSGDLDIRYNIKDNWNLGFQFGYAVMVKDISYDNGDMLKGTSMGSFSSILVSDYYFNSGNSLFAPFVGGGLGYFTYGNLAYSPDGQVNDNTEIEVKNKLGGILRAGFELWRIRLGVEYYLIPKSILKDHNNVEVGETQNNYLNISLGFYIGGGKWRK